MLILSPAGAFQERLARMGIPGCSVRGKLDLARTLAREIRCRSEVAFFATAIWHSLLFAALKARAQRRTASFQFVMGGTNERDAFSHKRCLNPLDVTFICPTAFMREKPGSHGVDESRVQVIPHFLSAGYAEQILLKLPIRRDGIHSAVVVSRVEPIKRIDVLLDALDRTPELSGFPIRILGTGSLLEDYRERARRNIPNVSFVGFTDHAFKESRDADLLHHLCPEVPGGLAVIEGLATRSPVLVADSGGTASIVKGGQSGYFFRGNGPRSLADELLQLRRTPAEELDRVAGNARASFGSTYCESRVVDRFRSLILDQLEAEAYHHRPRQRPRTAWASRSIPSSESADIANSRLG